MNIEVGLSPCKRSYRSRKFQIKNLFLINFKQKVTLGGSLYISGLFGHFSAAYSQIL